ncbi:uncharacterized protein L3040_003063 [Drepanopeziza brunnea f. sp. 'multigermtubi']|uniref:uncharacterized protein n=1 Tax=Drepanopeziza brunnea f. sp. 'multigermtubi' TaxID=698441 RepID=UPI002386E260|nr:hypothetical protein L3040_003063 [Drepanopeziza brunnea f. sp. 'multigermtubi']
MGSALWKTGRRLLVLRWSPSQNPTYGIFAFACAPGIDTMCETSKLPLQRRTAMVDLADRPTGMLPNPTGKCGWIPDCTAYHHPICIGVA